MSDKRISFFVFLVLSIFQLNGQECHIQLKGVVQEKGATPLSYANIYIKELKSGVASEENGKYKFNNICPGNYHIVISHIGCESIEYYLSLQKDTTINFELEHHHQLLDEVSIEGIQSYSETQNVKQISLKKIAEMPNENLGNMLENISGVSTINNGNRISKPVVNGMYGNRLLILNNGIAQSGQQWGVDHSPEIDPLSAQSISVIKGVGALEFQGSNLGSVVLVESGKINNDPHLHGHARYFFESNGLSNGVNFQLEQGRESWGWKINTTLKKSGDQNTPDYFLTNTAYEEASASALLEKRWSEKFNSELYFSTFNTNLGILRGSQVGNLTDLQSAFEREEPFFTEDALSFEINPPRQEVNHHLLKLKSKWLLDENRFFDFVVAQQWNFRQEYDVRRSGRSDKPSLSLEQRTQFAEVKYHYFTSSNSKWKLGGQYQGTENINVPETGILPLIPNYISAKWGLFALWSKEYERLSLEGGLRYDFENRRVATISNTFPREVLNYDNNYHNYSFVVGGAYEFQREYHLNYNLGLTSRNPEVNELYSNGLHQGVSGIEEGNPNLVEEQSIKQTLSIEKHLGSKIHLELMTFYQYFQNYIFLNPQEEFRLTIRGAFPVFKYEQTQAEIYGFDLVSSMEFNERWSALLKYSFIQGNDLDNREPIVFLPSNNLRTELNYQIPLKGQWENLELQLNHQSVFEQTHINEDQDFVPPPETYHLIGFKASVARKLGKNKLNATLQINNLFNTVYRDYLNRQRYFADDIGRNITIALNYTF